MRPNYLLLLSWTLVVGLAVCCYGYPVTGDSNKVTTLKIDADHVSTAAQGRNSRPSTDVKADEDDEERGLELFTKLKALPKKFPVLNKYQALLRKNRGPSKVKALVKNDPQLNKLKSAVGNRKIRVTKSDVQRLESIVSKNPKEGPGILQILAILALIGVIGSGVVLVSTLISAMNKTPKA